MWYVCMRRIEDRLSKVLWLRRRKSMMMQSKAKNNKVISSCLNGDKNKKANNAHYQ